MSDRAWRDASTLEPVNVEWDSDFASVMAFCAGSTVSYSSAPQKATRWNHIIAVPLYSDGEILGRLPVGTLTLTSTAPEGRSVFSRGYTPLLGIMRVLEIVGSQMMGAEPDR